MSKTIRAAIKELSEGGISGYSISRELKKAGIDCSQATISRIKTGTHKKVDFDTGVEILNIKKRLLDNNQNKRL